MSTIAVRTNEVDIQPSGSTLGAEVRGVDLAGVDEARLMVRTTVAGEAEDNEWTM